MHTFTHTHTYPGLDSRAGEAGDRQRCLFLYPSSPSLTTSKDFSESVKPRLIAALAVSAMFKNRRREQRGSHFKITFPPLTGERERDHKTAEGRGKNGRRAGTLWWQGAG